jgi:transposase
VELVERIRRDHRLEKLSIRELSRRHKVHRRTVRDALASAAPPPRRTTPRERPVFGPYEATVRQWLEEDKEAPKKQRHTARRVHKRLVGELGARISESTVRENVRRIRADIAPAPTATVPQVHEPGFEAEVDFGELWAVIAGVLVKLWLFSLRLSCSGRACHRVFATQAQEAFLAGHVDAFSRLGALPARIRYDNLKPAVARVLLGRDRVESERFIVFRSHHGFDSFYCVPGPEGAHEKGGVEGDVGWFRRNHLTPVPRAESLAALNAYVVACDEEDLGRVIEGRSATVGAEFALEAPWLSSLPAEPFDTARRLSARVDAKSRVTVRQCRYSVPVSLIGRRVQVALDAEEVALCAGGVVVARHERLARRGEESLVLDHYLETLVRKPGGLACSVPLAQARASGAFSATHEAYWAEARRQLGDKDGTRALIEVLLLERVLPAEAVRAAMRAALALHTTSPQVVAVESRRAAGERIAPVIPIGALERYERPAPDLAAYDGLLAERHQADRGSEASPVGPPEASEGDGWTQTPGPIAGETW